MPAALQHENNKSLNTQEYYPFYLINKMQWRIL